MTSTSRRRQIALLMLLLCACSANLAFAEEEKKDAVPAAATAPAEDPHKKPDPTGATVGADFGLEFSGAKKPGQPTIEEVTAQVTKNRGALNMLWTCLAGFMVFFMQAGFALVETGFTRAKNAAHTMGMNMMVFCIGFVGYYICGFAFMFGGYSIGGVRWERWAARR